MADGANDTLSAETMALRIRSSADVAGERKSQQKEKKEKKNMIDGLFDLLLIPRSIRPPLSKLGYRQIGASLMDHLQWVALTNYCTGPSVGHPLEYLDEEPGRALWVGGHLLCRQGKVPLAP